MEKLVTLFEAIGRKQKVAGPTPAVMFSTMKKALRQMGFVQTDSENTWAEMKCWMKTNSRFTGDDILNKAKEVFPDCEWEPAYEILPEHKKKTIGAQCDSIGALIEKQGSGLFVSFRKQKAKHIPMGVDPTDLEYSR